MVEREIGFALHDQPCGILARGARAVEVLDFVCRHLGTSPSPVPPRLVLEARADGVFVLSKDGAVMETHASELGAADALMRELTQVVLWDYASGLALHSALVGIGGKGVLFPAASGVGKSTLTVFAAASGHAFFTDELVFTGVGQPLRPLRRPAHLKAGSAFVVDGFASIAAHPDVWRSKDGVLIAPHAFPVLGAEPPALDAIVFPRWSRGAALELRELRPAEAAFKLLGALLNARNLHESGVPETAQVARSTRAFELTYGSLEEALVALCDRLGG